MTNADTITVEHYEKIYHRTGRWSWTWTYAVTVPGEKHRMIGDCVGWARDIAARKSRETGFPVVDTTKKARNS